MVKPGVTNNLYYKLVPGLESGKFKFSIESVTDDIKDKVSWVYLIYNPSTDTFKIGRAGSIKKCKNRLGAGQIWHTTDLQYKGHVRGIEKQFHTVLKEWNVKGEWFKFPYEYITQDNIRLNLSNLFERRIEGDGKET